MISFSWFVVSPLGKALGWMLIHSIWQITIIAAILNILLRFVPRKLSNIRYVFLLAGLIGIVAWSAFTYFSTLDTMAWPASEASLEVTIATGSAEGMMAPEPWVPIDQGQLQQWRNWLDGRTQTITWVWLVGVLLSCLYLIFGLSYLHHLQRHRVHPPSAEWQERFGSLCQQMGIRRKVRLLFSEVVKDPITFQLWRPVILLPVSLVTGLNTQQIELLLLHELAHIRRYDFAINILQTLVEIVFFYHPALWWISRNIRATREHCCDDAVLAVQNQPILYAEALTRIRYSNLSLKKRLAMSAINNKGLLSKRIFRLFGQYESQPPIYRSAFLALLLLFIGLGSQAFRMTEEPATVVESEPLRVMEESPVEEPASWLDESIAAENPEPKSEPTVAAGQLFEKPKVEGKVVDEQGQPLIGVNVIIKDTRIGTITDFDGNFSIELPEKCVTLVFSYVGKQTKEQANSCGGQQLDIILKPKTAATATHPVLKNRPTVTKPAEKQEEAKKAPIIIEGQVKDEAQNPLIGTSILIKGTKTGTITDLQGYFELRLPSDCATLIFNYVGKEVEEVANACGGQKLDIVMKAKSEAGEIPSANQQKEATKKDPEIVEGFVIDEAGKPLIGTNILVKGKKTGTITDFKGYYRLALPDECATLIFSYVGKETREISEVCKGQKIGVQLTAKDAIEKAKPAPTQKMEFPEIQITPESEVKQLIRDMKVFPNPASGPVRVSFILEKTAKVIMTVYTPEGKAVYITIPKFVAGPQEIVWDNSNKMKGNFLIQLEVEGQKLSKQVILE